MASVLKIIICGFIEFMDLGLDYLNICKFCDCRYDTDPDCKIRSAVETALLLSVNILITTILFSIKWHSSTYVSRFDSLSLTFIAANDIIQFL